MSIYYPEDQQATLLTRIVAQVLSIEDVTWGNKQQRYIVRFRGKLIRDSETAYDQVADSLRPLGITPLFRLDDNKHCIILIPGVITPSSSKPWINLILFVLTLISMVVSGALYAYAGPISPDPRQMLIQFIKNLPQGLPFAISLLSILFAHEFGHYLAGRYHKAQVTLPYFIPFPLSPFGTMGAFIQMKAPPKNKRVMLDLGIAGPLAGLVVAIPILFIGLSTSPLNSLPNSPTAVEGLSLEGNSILYLLVKFLVFGKLLPAPLNYGNIPPLLYWLKYILIGRPLPWGGLDVSLNSVAWAAWAGLLVTSFNLIPAGQLDGGHLLYILLGDKTRKVLPIILISLVALGVIWTGWWIWAIIIYFLGRTYAEPLDQITPLDAKRRYLAIFGIILFFLVFIPVPITIIG